MNRLSKIGLLLGSILILICSLPMVYAQQSSDSQNTISGKVSISYDENADGHPGSDFFKDLSIVVFDEDSYNDESENDIIYQTTPDNEGNFEIDGLSADKSYRIALRLPSQFKNSISLAAMEEELGTDDESDELTVVQADENHLNGIIDDSEDGQFVDQYNFYLITDGIPDETLDFNLVYNHSEGDPSLIGKSIVLFNNAVGVPEGTQTETAAYTISNPEIFSPTFDIQKDDVTVGTGTIENGTFSLGGDENAILYFSGTAGSADITEDVPDGYEVSSNPVHVKTDCADDEGFAFENICLSRNLYVTADTGGHAESLPVTYTVLNSDKPVGGVQAYVQDNPDQVYTTSEDGTITGDFAGKTLVFTGLPYTKDNSYTVKISDLPEIYTCEEPETTFSFEQNQGEVYHTFSLDCIGKSLSVSLHSYYLPDDFSSEFEVKLNGNPLSDTVYTVDGISFKTDANGHFILQANKTAVFTEVGIEDEPYEVTQVLSDSFTQVEPEDGTAVAGALSDNSVASFTDMGNEVFVLEDDITANDKDNDSQNSYIESVTKYQDVREMEADTLYLTVNGSPYPAADEQVTVYDTWSDSSQTVEWKAGEGITLMPGQEVILPDIPVNSSYSVTTTSNPMIVSEEGSVIDDSVSYTGDILTTNTKAREEGIYTGEPVVFADEVMSRSYNSKIGFNLTDYATIPAVGATLTYQVQKYNGSSWVPASGISYQINHDNKNGSGTLTTGSDGLIKTYFTGDYFPEVLFPSQNVYMNLYSGMKNGDYRIIERPDLSDASFGRFSSYLINSKSTLSESAKEGYFVNCNVASSFTVSKQTSGSSTGNFTFRVRQIVSASALSVSKESEIKETLPAIGLSVKIGSTTVKTDENGQFQLAAGQTATISVPKMTQWTVTENDPGEYYKLSSSGATTENGVTSVKLSSNCILLRTGDVSRSYVAQIGSVKFSTLQAAFDYADKIASSSSVNASRPVTINTIAKEITLSSAVTSKNAAVILQTMPDIGYTTSILSSGNGAMLTPTGNLTLKNIVLDGKNKNTTAPMITSSGSLTLSSGSVLKNLTLGSATQDTVLGVEAKGAFTLEGGTVQDMKSNTANYYAYAVRLRSTGTIKSGNVKNCTFAKGTAVCIWDGTTTFSGGTLQNLNSSLNGGAICVRGSATLKMTGGTIKNCTANGGRGGGVYTYGTSTFNMTGGTIDSCTALNGGGCAFTDRSQATLSGGEIKNCTAGINNTNGSGGGVYTYFSKDETTGLLKITGSVKIHDNQVTGPKSMACGGGGISHHNGGRFLMDGGEIYSNISFFTGGGVQIFAYTSTDLNKITGGTIRNNTAEYGGGICIDYPSLSSQSGTTVCGLTVSGSTKISSNEASKKGGGICLYGGLNNLIIGGSAVIEKNLGTEHGAGVCEYNNNNSFISTIKMEGGTISNNTAGIMNVASGGGAGMYIFKNCTLTMTGGTITGNTSINGGAGGIALANNSSLTMSGGTVSSNKAINGGGIQFGAGAVTINGSSKIINNICARDGAGGGIFSLTNGANWTISGNTLIDGNRTATKAEEKTYLWGPAAATDGKFATGAGIRIGGNNSKMVINGNVKISNNSGGIGAGIFAQGSSTLELSGYVIITENHENAPATTTPNIPGTLNVYGCASFGESGFTLKLSGAPKIYNNYNDANNGVMNAFTGYKVSPNFRCNVRVESDLKNADLNFNSLIAGQPFGSANTEANAQSAITTGLKSGTGGCSFVRSGTTISIR